MHATGREFDEEEDVEALQEKRVDGGEVALENARRLLAQEVGPACLKPLSAPARSGPQPPPPGSAGTCGGRKLGCALSWARRGSWLIGRVSVGGGSFSGCSFVVSVLV